MDTLETQRKVAVLTLATIRAMQLGCDSKRIEWVGRMALTMLGKGHSAWRSLQIAEDYAARIAPEVAA
jgi:hypothetical protein